MTARRPIRRCSRKTRRSCRKNCRRALKKRPRSWKPTRRRALLQIRPRSNAGRKTTKRRPVGAFLVWPNSFSRMIDERELVERRIAWAIAARFVLHKNLGDLRMPDRLTGIVGQQILLG